MTEIVAYPFTLGSFFILIIILALLFMSGFISASEIAFFSLTPNDWKEIEKKNVHTDTTILLLQNSPERLLASILIASNTLNVAIVILTTFFINSLFDFSRVAWLGFLIQTVIITFLLLLISEIGPKIYAGQYPLTFSRKSAGTLRVIEKILYPFATILVKSSKLADKHLKVTQHNLSIDDLGHAVELTTKKDDDDKEILEGIIKFRNKTVQEVMTVRLNVDAIDIENSFPEVKQQLIQSGYSRIPVYKDNLDTIKGVLYNKDLLPHLDKDDRFQWQTIIREAYFVPEKKMIDDLLKDFQTNKNHLAVVVDEFGGTSGIVTLEDILEEVVGEIDDEYDEPTVFYSVVNKNTIDFEGQILLDDFFRLPFINETDFREIHSDADTLAGLLLELHGSIPELHEMIVWRNYQFEITEVSERRIIKIRMTVN